ncbi:cytochrome P450 [Streptomyces sp. NBC_01390]|uniref:cytochrome P450 family protein n=1 Tax=Streptomyces sp. NBC_01390 TaxID=2903850 RepID=UPI00325138A9
MDQQQPLLLDPAGRDLLGEARRLRETGPAVRVVLPGEIPAWYITRHQLLKSLLLDDRVSKDPGRHWPAWREGAFRDTWIINWVGVSNMLTAYGPAHRRLRKLIAPAFTARRTQAMVPQIERITHTLLDSLAQSGPGGVADLRTAFAHPLPMRVICELFGLPEAARTDVARLISRIMDTTITAQEAETTQKEVRAVLAGLVALKRANPGDDLTSVLVDVRDEDGSRLSEEELIDTLLLIIGAGHETTVNLIGNAVHALLTHPGQLERVRAGAVSWDDVIEETLRWAPSIASLPLRFAVTDIPLPDGATIRAGEAILTTYAAAGHDPDQHGATAAEFDPGRAATDHLAFGHGVHHCIGAPLARLEAKIALPALFARFPGLALAPEASDLARVESFISHGFQSLPVRLGSVTSPS